MAIEALSGWTREQKSVVAAAYLGWMLDAFDFFLMVFVFRDIAAEFHTQIPAVAVAVVLTLAMRPIGAFIFGRDGGPLRPAADACRRHPDLFLAGFCLRISPPALPCCWCCARCSALPWAANGAWARRSPWRPFRPSARGLVSGILQAGYPERISGRICGVRTVVPVHRLARHVHDRDRAGSTGLSSFFAT